VHFSIDQIERSLQTLQRVHPFFGFSFLAFKRHKLPVGQSQRVNFSQVTDGLLKEFYKPTQSHDGYYSPFITSDTSKRWLAKRYGSAALQRITKDTFADALEHPTKNDWGWRSNYVAALAEHLKGNRLPAFDLAVWLFRGESWPMGVLPESIRDALFERFKISRQERQSLFDEYIPELANPWLAEQPVSEDSLLEVIGYPPGSIPLTSDTIRLLELQHIGPARTFCYEPSHRLNIITGDNSLGKTFVLDCLWRVLTGEWLEYPVVPRRTVGKSQPRIRFEFAKGSRTATTKELAYNWDKQIWVPETAHVPMPGLAIYARFDGSFAVWDPALVHLSESSGTNGNRGHAFFSRIEVWEGLRFDTNTAQQRWVCNGLLRDWVVWQTGGERHRARFEALRACLKALSPSDGEPLEPGEPVRVPLDSREIPTLKMPYGSVPVIHASAAVQRVVALAYLMVWTWHEHLANSELVRRKPQRRLVMIIDEVEAHLHPRWQRVIVPAIMSVVRRLSSEVSPQIHLATHSPLVMASAETIFGEEDALHHLRLEGNDVKLEILPFVRRGTADAWLMNDVFGLDHARSLPSAKAIEEAKKLQLSASPASDDVVRVHRELERLLAPDDEFWPRWRFFALKHGLKE
jgi:hypothetical protein